MRVLVVGSRWFGAEVFRLVTDRGHQVPAVVVPSEGDRLATAARASLVPVTVAPWRVSAADVPEGVDLVVCAHAHAFVDAAARAVAGLGALGYHPSLLPLHRGRDAIRWTIRDRDRVTGGTVYWLTDKADAGPVAAQDWCFVRPDDTAETLWRRELGPMGVRLLGKALDEVAGGVAQRVPQDEALATWEPGLDSGKLRGGA